MSREEDRAPLSTEVSPQPHRSEGSVQPQTTATGERLKVGERLSGRYRIERELGEGGMGVVYLVADEQVPGERFAIKVLKEGLDPEALSLLREEVRKTRKLSHPNIVDVHSVNVDSTRLYVLMEYLEGKSLDTLLDEEFGRGTPFSHAWPIIEDVGAALGYAHNHNVIHSDLKPANVFLTTSGKTKLLDFGIARVSRGPLLHQRSGPLALTPAYASSEMLQGKEADARDDIYSFACVIYEMLCGKRPFGELTALEAREAGAQVPPLAVLSREQNAALAQALAFDRKGRTASVEGLLVGLADKRPRAWPPRAVLAGATIAAVAVLGLTFWALDKLWISRPSVEVRSVAPEAQPAVARAAATPNAATFSPPPHSIAVLPFVNMSGNREQEYFSDGLSEELLNDLSRINELQVAARTSAFSFKGKDTDIGTIARKLNVGVVLEGSVRRAGRKIRVTAQLNNAVTGFHLWSQTYDRDFGDVLNLQAEIATAVAAALKVALLGDVAAKIELGGTRNAIAFDAYLRGSRAYYSAHHGVSDVITAIEAYSKAIQLDPKYALAYAGRSGALSDHAFNFATVRNARAEFDKAMSDAHAAIALAPELAEGYGALASVLENGFFDFAGASENYQRAVAFAPGNAWALSAYGRSAVFMGHADAGIAAARQATVLDPLNPHIRTHLVWALLSAHQYMEAVTAADALIAFDPDTTYAYAMRGLASYALGDFQNAISSCAIKPDLPMNQACLAVTYNKLGRHADAEAVLVKYQESVGERGAYHYGVIYAQWGDIPKALLWLETALRLRDPGLVQLRTDPLLDPLRKEPRFQAIERELKFPN